MRVSSGDEKTNSFVTDVIVHSEKTSSSQNFQKSLNTLPKASCSAFPQAILNPENHNPSVPAYPQDLLALAPSPSTSLPELVNNNYFSSSNSINSTISISSNLLQPALFSSNSPQSSTFRTIPPPQSPFQAQQPYQASCRYPVVGYPEADAPSTSHHAQPSSVAEADKAGVDQSSSVHQDNADGGVCMVVDPTDQNKCTERTDRTKCTDQRKRTDRTERTDQTERTERTDVLLHNSILSVSPSTPVSVFPFPEYSSHVFELVSPKARALIMFLLDSCKRGIKVGNGSESEDVNGSGNNYFAGEDDLSDMQSWSALVFCEMRFCAVALCQLLNMLALTRRDSKDSLGLHPTLSQSLSAIAFSLQA